MYSKKENYKKQRTKRTKKRTQESNTQQYNFKNKKQEFNILKYF